ncbi:MAG: rhodanese-like domain-containing protein [Proteobacteria bacterium]|nr:rhodanese-like domain-containing protein [Pseudomonadota bacterium]
MQFLIHNIWLIILILGCAFFLVWPTLSRLFGGFKVVSPSEAVVLLNRSKVQVLDLRDRKSFERAHLKQAHHVELNELPKQIDGLLHEKNIRFLVYCQHGSQAHLAASRLKRAGVAEVFCLEGGIKAWQDAGLPVKAGVE